MIVIPLSCAYHLTVQNIDETVLHIHVKKILLPQCIIFAAHVSLLVIYDSIYVVWAC